MGNYTEYIHIIFDSNKMLSIKIKKTQGKRNLFYCADTLKKTEEYARFVACFAHISKICLLFNL